MSRPDTIKYVKFNNYSHDMQSTQIGELAHLSLNIKILYFFPNICQNLIP